MPSPAKRSTSVKVSPGERLVGIGDRTSGDRPRSERVEPADRGETRGLRWRWFTLAAVLAPLLLLCAVLGIDRMRYEGRALRNVVAHGVALGGMDPAAAERALADHEARLLTLPLTVEVGGKSFELVPSAVGLSLDVQGAVAKSMAAGREGGLATQIAFWLARLGSPHEIPVEATLDDPRLQQLLQTWETEALDSPPYEGAIATEGGVLVSKPPRHGRGIDRGQAHRLILTALVQTERPVLSLPLADIEPTRTAATLEATLHEAESLTAGPVTLVAAGHLRRDVAAENEPAAEERPRPRARTAVKQQPKIEPPAEAAPLAVTFTASQLRQAIRGRPKPGTTEYELYFASEALDPWLAEARQKLEGPPVDARFEVAKEDRVVLFPSRHGTRVDAAQVAEALATAARAPNRQAPFPVGDAEAPRLTTEAAQALNIAGLVSKFTTGHPCCQPRVENIHIIADKVDGVLLQPGQTFSINEWVGPRTPAAGFLPAPTIVEGEMEDTTGGGVSQFATTFFNAAFYGGYAILERSPHSYYFRRYPMGHEATLSYPKPDLVIQNDTKSGLLIKCYYTANSVTVKFYGDNEGRKVKRKISKVHDVTQPSTEYIPNPKLEPGDEKVKDRGKIGWTVVVSRELLFADGTSKDETRKVVYQPQKRKVEVHPCRIPEGEPAYTGEACPKKDEDEEGEKDEQDGPPTNGGGGPEPEGPLVEIPIEPGVDH